MLGEGSFCDWLRILPGTHGMAVDISGNIARVGSRNDCRQPGIHAGQVPRRARKAGYSVFGINLTSTRLLIAAILFHS